MLLAYVNFSGSSHTTTRKDLAWIVRVKMKIEIGHVSSVFFSFFLIFKTVACRGLCTNLNYKDSASSLK